jgi:hypothetical protein
MSWPTEVNASHSNPHDANAPQDDVPCNTVFPGTTCLTEAVYREERFLAVMCIALACSLCALFVLATVLTALVHKLSLLWVRTFVRPAPVPTIEPSDDPRKGLLRETKSCLRVPSDSNGDGRDDDDDDEEEGGGGSSGSGSTHTEGRKKKKAKKTSFSDDTSCATPRDIDEEDL